MNKVCPLNPKPYVYLSLFKLFEFLEVVMLLSSVLVYELLDLRVGIAQLLDQLPPIILLVQVPNILQHKPQKSTEGWIFVFVCSF